MKIFRSDYEAPNPEIVFNEIQTSGIVCLEQCLDADFLTSCRQQAQEEISNRGQRYFTVPDITYQADSPLARIVSDQKLMSLIENICQQSGIRHHEGRLLQGNNLRVIAGSGLDAEAQSLKFHYDSSILTMLVPVLIPDLGDLGSGHLIARLNHRPFGKSIVVNLLQKLLIQNRLYRQLQKLQLRAGKWNENIIRLEPGSLYLFWGYRSLHANLPCMPGSQRATALFFFGRPHPNDFVMKMRELWRDRKEALILEGKR